MPVGSIRCKKEAKYLPTRVLGKHGAYGSTRGMEARLIGRSGGAVAVQSIAANTQLYAAGIMTPDVGGAVTTYRDRGNAAQMEAASLMGSEQNGLREACYV